MKRRAAVMAALMIVLLGLSVFAQAPAKHAVTPEELVTMTRMQGAEISPDGSRILCVASRTIYAQSDINHGVAGEGEFLGNPYDNPDNFARGSAVYHIRTVKTPVLILHGKEESRVPYVQGLELFRALKTAGKEVERVAYPGEEHGFRKPVHNIDRLKCWSAFYDKHLGIVRPQAQEAKITENGVIASRKMLP